MPVMDGWEFMEEIKMIKSKISKKIIIYIVSSSIALEDKNKSKTFPDIFGYIPKPISVADLLSIFSEE
jgi:CheY-like chemotaxis protein